MTKAVIMAGGEGTRLRPLTINRPKPMVPLLNKPLMEYAVERLSETNLRDIYVTLHYLPVIVTGYFEDGSRWNVRLKYSIEDRPLGTAGGVRAIFDGLDDTLIVVSGDLFSDINLGSMLDFHKSKGSVFTMALVTVENPLEFGVALLDHEGRLKKFIEKPGWGEVFSNTINAGIYIIEPEVLELIPKGSEFDFSRDLIPLLLKRDYPVYGYIHNGYWKDVGNTEQYRKVHEELLDNLKGIRILSKPFDDKIYIGSECSIDPTAMIIGPVLIGSNVTIKENTVIGPYVVIGDNVIIERGTKIEHSIIWSGSFVGSRSQLSGSIVGEHVTIKSGVYAYEGSVIGDECTIGNDVIIKSGVRIWPKKNIESGLTISSDITASIKSVKKLFGIHGIDGIANIEITPELASKIGAALATIVKPGSVITASRDMMKASRMLKRAFISGLLSAGANVYNLRAIPSPLSRLFVVQSSSEYGVHIRMHNTLPDVMHIEIYDSSGLNINPIIERKIENLVYREDYRRVDYNIVGDIYYPSRVYEPYEDYIYKSIDISPLNRWRERIVIDLSQGTTSLILPQLLSRLGIDTILINLASEIGYRTSEKRSELSSFMHKVVRSTEASAGFIIDQSGERLLIVDEKGRTLSGLQSLMLMMMIASDFNVKKFAIPMSISSRINEFADRYNISLTRTDISSYSLGLAIKNNDAQWAGDEDGGYITSNIILGFDAIASLIHIISYMAEHKIKLSEIVDSLPSIQFISEEVHCPANLRISILEKLYYNYMNNITDLMRGLRIKFESGWVFVTPSLDESIIRIYADAKEHEHAKVLLEKIKSDIQQYIRE
ncbi:MAG: sugar phosphate nucleotidyltransferase [Thermoprotei archaeon]|jgi:mannose-1-phosphate guanylyltransferase/phosphomannomutase